ncbi:MAG: hypothetical protein COU63_02895 [Candidatus Pacebacteria bacterium CG10_big_fil_rev_8_21_14_0_10_36_11]|nr:hypothetical protein [Candidatus Pacearchaeota archaeon]OIP74377.1 MAG: hypothetical protein AUK08_01155 [Candidatus Pacebacteria bacterium CG2_30_36_39]PIR64940.1 MAG: hypothetical protein COU63_02895 [Candidatus Pacebacteria bacterium CG10_big_fil_rev_8_21_14_0_10_36_11]
MNETDRKRDESQAADIRKRQNWAAKFSRRKTYQKDELIDDLNTDSFIAQALKNGLNLVRIAREAAEEAAKKKD